MTRKQFASLTSALAVAAVTALGAAGVVAASPDERGEYANGTRYVENEREHDRYEYRDDDRREYDSDDRYTDDRSGHREDDDREDGGRERSEHQ